jgi:hypothetical protein
LRSISSERRKPHLRRNASIGRFRFPFIFVRYSGLE